MGANPDPPNLPFTDQVTEELCHFMCRVLHAGFVQQQAVQRRPFQRLEAHFHAPTDQSAVEIAISAWLDCVDFLRAAPLLELIDRGVRQDRSNGRENQTTKLGYPTRRRGIQAHLGTHLHLAADATQSQPENLLRRAIGGCCIEISDSTPQRFIDKPPGARLLEASPEAAAAKSNPRQ